MVEKGKEREDELEEKGELGWSKGQEEEDKGGPTCTKEEGRTDPQYLNPQVWGPK